MVARATCANLSAQHPFIILPEGFIMIVLFVLHVVVKVVIVTCILFVLVIKIVLHVFRDGTKVGKQPLKLRQQKPTKVRRFAHVFINVGLTLIVYRKSPKHGYCFIMRTSVVPVSVSIKIRHCWTEK